MKLPTQLPAGACWLTLPDDRLLEGERAPDRRQWRHRGNSNVALPIRSFDSPERAPAAVRLLGEGLPGDATPEWCAAIDPITLAADMRDVRIQVWPQLSLDGDSASQLIKSIEALLCDDDDQRLRRMRIVQCAPSRWYLVGARADALNFDTTAPAQLRGEPLRHHKPTGPDGRLIQRLSTEVQMQMHQHPVNVTREAAGKSVVNAVWLWGSGTLAQDGLVALPPLVSDDAYWKGCWRLLAPDSDVHAAPMQGPLVDGCVVAPGTADAARLAAMVFSSPAISTVYAASPTRLDIYERHGWFGRLLAQMGKQQ